jgi:cyclohexanone monooxygenase
MLFLIGPNTGLAHTSMIYMIESQISYLAGALRHMQLASVATFDVRDDVAADYNQALQRRMRRTIWTTGGCVSWYLDEHGNNTTLWPDFTFAFRRLTRSFDAEAYRTTARADRAGAPVAEDVGV